MGVLLVEKGELEAAIPFFKTALEGNLSSSQFWYSYINALINLENFFKAKLLFDQAIGKGAEGYAFDELASV